MGLTLHPLLIQEIQRLGFNIRDLALIQLLSLTTIGVFSFLLQETVLIHPKVGGCFFWLTQGSAIFMLSDRLFDKDLHQGFFINVINSSISLPTFIGLRWVLFTVAFAGSTALIMPITLTLLGLKTDFWCYFFLMIFPYAALTIGYSSLLSLLTHGMRSYLMPILLLPLTIPIVILVTSGSLGIDIKVCFIYLISLILCGIPLIIYLIKIILQTIYEDF